MKKGYDLGTRPITGCRFDTLSPFHTCGLIFTFSMDDYRLGDPFFQTTSDHKTSVYPLLISIKDAL